MLADAQNKENLISVWIHATGPMSEADMERMVGIMNETGAALERKNALFSTTLFIVESTHLPDAKQRQLMGVTSRQLRRGYLAVVNRSMLVRGVMTAMRWINPNKDFQPFLFATFEEARAWLVAQTGHPAALFDKLYAEARSKVGNAAARSGTTP